MRTGRTTSGCFSARSRNVSGPCARAARAISLGLALACVAPGFAADEPAPPFAQILKIDAHAHTFAALPELDAGMREANDWLAERLGMGSA